jgi:hypothetical protein
MNKAIPVFISAASFLVSTHAIALTRVTVPDPMPIPQATMHVPAQVLAKKEGGKKEKKFKEGKQDKKLEKEKKLKGSHKNKGEHKSHNNNEHSNAGDGKLHGLDRADDSAGEHGHRDKARSHSKHEKD